MITLKQNKTNIALKADGGSGNNGVPITTEVIERTITLTILDNATGEFIVELNEPLNKDLGFTIYRDYTTKLGNHISGDIGSFYIFKGDTSATNRFDVFGNIVGEPVIIFSDNGLPEFTTKIDDYSLLYREERKQFKVDDIFTDGIYLKAEDGEHLKANPEIYPVENSLVKRDEEARIFTRSYSDISELEDAEAASVAAVYEIAQYLIDENGTGGNVDLTDYVKNTDYATNKKAGIIKTSSSLGFYVSPEGELSTIQASESEIKFKTNKFHPITPNNLDYAVKEALTSNKQQALTSTEAYNAHKWLGVDTALKNTKNEIIDELSNTSVKEIKQTSSISLSYEQDEYASFTLEIYPPLSFDLSVPLYRDFGIQGGEDWWESDEWVTIPAGETFYYGQFMPDGLAIPETVSASLYSGGMEGDNWIYHDSEYAEYITDRFTLINGDKVHASRIFVESGTYDEWGNAVYEEVATKSYVERLIAELNNGGNG